MKKFSVIAGVLAALCVATMAWAQPEAARRLVGREIGGHSRFDGRATTETATLTFKADDGGPAFTVDFIARFEGQRPASAPRVVDVAVTRHAIGEDAPAMTMRVNGESLPLVARLQGRQSIVATISFDELQRMTNAETLVERAFDNELELSDLQLKMLRSMVQRWAGR
jgi:hypothetical protein